MRFHAPAVSVIVQPADPEPVGLVRAFDRQPQFLRQHAGLAAIVEMTVGNEQLLQRHPRFGDGILQLSRSPPGSTSAPRIVRVHHISEQFC